MDLMRREGFSERELDLLRQSQKNSDNLVNLEKQAFAAIKGLYDDGYGNFTYPARLTAISLSICCSAKRYTGRESQNHGAHQPVHA